VFLKLEKPDFTVQNGVIPHMPVTFIIRRFATALITLFLASVMVFGALLVIPGDPVQLLLGLNYDPGTYKVLQQKMGLDKPPLERYARWIGGLPRGDLGVSLSKTAPVTQLIVNTIPVTVPLIVLSTVLALLIALPGGVYAAQHRGSGADVIVVTLTQAGLAIPSFWLGLILALLFAVTLRWLPANGWTAWTDDPTRALKSLILPVVTLALGQAAGLVRMVRSSVLDVLNQDYVRTARSKGLQENIVINKHVLRNAAIQIVTLLGIQLGQLLAGAIIVESVFNLPGMGRLGLDAVKSSDFPLVQGVVFTIAAVIVGINLIVDLLYGALDPRIRYD
jgi:peptide/nickel transport system permease protein